jgi:HEAT repeat protein
MARIKDIFRGLKKIKREKPSSKAPAEPLHVIEKAPDLVSEALPGTGIMPGGAQVPDVVQPSAAAPKEDAFQDKVSRMNRLLEAAQKYVPSTSTQETEESAPKAAPLGAQTQVMPEGRIPTEVMPGSRVLTEIMSNEPAQTQIMEDAPVQTQIMKVTKDDIVQTVTEIRRPLQTAVFQPQTRFNEPVSSGPLTHITSTIADPPTIFEAPMVERIVTPKANHQLIEAFGEDIIRELLDEVSFLVSQCMSDPFHPERRWPDAADVEARLAVQTKAISLRSDRTFNRALDLLEGDDPWNLRGAAFSLVAADGVKAMPHIRRRLEAAADSLIPSLTEAMMCSSYPHLTDEMVSMFSSERREVRAASLTVAAFRGDLTAEQVWGAVRREKDFQLVSILSDDLSKLPLPSQSSIWQRLLDSDVSAARQAAVFSMLKSGQTEAVRYLSFILKGQAPPEPWVFEYWGLCGGKYAFELLEKWCEVKACRAFAVRSMGRLGNIQAVSSLLPVLSDDEDDTAQAAAADALHRITGARLPSRTEWETWLQVHRNELLPNCFFRFGEPFRFSRLVDEITDEKSTPRDRAAAHMEFAVRSGSCTPLNIAWTVEKQRQAVSTLGELNRRLENRLPPGEWTFGGAGFV